MKSTLLLLLTALCCSFGSYAQIYVGPRVQPFGGYTGKFKNDDLQRLKATTTIFTIPVSQYHLKEDFEKAIKETWKVTPFKIVKASELYDYLQPEYSIFSFGGVFKMVQGRGGGTITNIYYDLWMPEFDKEGKVKDQEFFARIGMFADIETLLNAFELAFSRKESGRLLPYLNSREYHNWGAGFLKGYLRVINDKLENGATISPYTSLENNEALTSLRNDTLYIPEYVMLHFSPIRRKEKQREADEVLNNKTYPYPAKVISSAVLDQMILESPNPLKYLVYLRSNTEKFVSLYSSDEQSLVYADFVKLSFNFQDKDLEKLSKTLKKAK